MSTSVDIEVEEQVKLKIKEPSMYRVIFLNDDFTPIEFVIELLVQIFKHSMETAKEITLKVHEEGSGVVGTYAYEIAEQKQKEAITASRNFGFPLRVVIEEDV